MVITPLDSLRFKNLSILQDEIFEGLCCRVMGVCSVYIIGIIKISLHQTNQITIHYIVPKVFQNSEEAKHIAYQILIQLQEESKKRKRQFLQRDIGDIIALASSFPGHFIFLGKSRDLIFPVLLDPSKRGPQWIKKIKYSGKKLENLSGRLCSCIRVGQYYEKLHPEKGFFIAGFFSGMVEKEENTISLETDTQEEIKGGSYLTLGYETTSGKTLYFAVVISESIPEYTISLPSSCNGRLKAKEAVKKVAEKWGFYSFFLKEKAIEYLPYPLGKEQTLPISSYRRLQWLKAFDSKGASVRLICLCKLFLVVVLWRSKVFEIIFDFKKEKREAEQIACQLASRFFRDEKLFQRENFYEPEKPFLVLIEYKTGMYLLDLKEGKRIQSYFENISKMIR